MINPYYEQAKPFVVVDDEWYLRTHLDQSYTKRRELVQEFAWSIPTDEVVKSLAASHKKGIVEIGAGTGYWAWLLQQCGVHVMPFDSAPPSKGANPYRHVKEWTTVHEGAPQTLQMFAPNWTLLLSWPPYSESFGADCLKSFKGDKVIFIGEDEGGCTGTDEMWNIFRHHWDLIDKLDIPQWQGIHDRVMLYTRRKVTS